VRQGAQLDQCRSLLVLVTVVLVVPRPLLLDLAAVLAPWEDN
jgi:hypothetical protein